MFHCQGLIAKHALGQFPVRHERKVIRGGKDGPFGGVIFAKTWRPAAFDSQHPYKRVRHGATHLYSESKGRGHRRVF